MGRHSKRDYIAGGRNGLRATDAGSNSGYASEVEMRHALAASYQSMFAAILLPISVYFALTVFYHLFIADAAGHAFLSVSSALIAMAFLAMGLDVRRRALSYRELEFFGFAFFALINLKAAANNFVQLEPAKLFFFMLPMLIVAIFGISTRLVVTAILSSVATMLAFASQAGGDMLLQASMIALAGSLAGYCISTLTRGAISREIRARVTAETLRQTAEAQADQDMLTELPNRRNFFRRLRERLERGRAGGEEFVLGVVDLDGFKSINDSYGHTVGDLLLIEVAARLRDAGGGNGLVSRLGGDEFAILIDGARNDEQLHGHGDTIRESIASPYLISDIEFSVSASVGFVRSTIADLNETGLIERADFAMFRAKANGSGTVIFSHEHEEDLEQIGRVEQALRSSDKEEEMSVVFQPQVDIASGETTGFEALARWNSPSLGNVRPDVFIAAAERTGLIEEMTPILLGKALKIARDWPGDIKLSFNLSIRDIMSSTAIDKLCRIIEASDIDPARLEFEVTETLIMSDFETARKSLAKLQTLGARVALDDFGVGYANFGHIDQLDINTIKIDRSFVTRLADGGRTAKVIKTMVDMCATLGVGSIIEGVETEQELDVLQGIGARKVQGYYYSKPMPPDEIPAFLSRRFLARIGGGPASVARAV